MELLEHETDMLCAKLLRCSADRSIGINVVDEHLAAGGRRSVPAISSSVVLPHPLGPRIATASLHSIPR